MAGLFPCSWSLPLAGRNTRPFDYARNLPVKPKPILCSYLPAVMPAEEQCALVDNDEKLENTVRQIQREADANYEPSQVLNMTKIFNRHFDGAIEKLNTMPPKKEVVDQRQLLDLMVAISRYSHILEGFVRRKTNIK